MLIWLKNMFICNCAASDQYNLFFEKTCYLNRFTDFLDLRGNNNRNYCLLVIIIGNAEIDLKVLKWKTG